MIADKHPSPPFATAHGEITREFGRQFDPQVVQAFLSISEQALEGIRLGIPGDRTPMGDQGSRLWRCAAGQHRVVADGD